MPRLLPVRGEVRGREEEGIVKTHLDTCEIYRGGEHGPCDCGYDAAQAERRRKVYTAEELIDLAEKETAARAREA